jgi:tetraacyldisaccharide 4'-kinase
MNGLNYLYWFGAAIHKRLTRVGRAEAPVVSVGNLAAGGVGKTPLIIKLATDLGRSDLAILSRGYRSQMEHAEEPRVVEGNNSRVFGDEPCLIAKRVPLAQVWVGKRRQLSAEKAVAEGARLLLLDDGLQFYKLAREIDIVVLDGEDLFGGWQRESPARLKSVDCVVVNHVRDLTHDAEVRKEVARYTAAPVVTMRMGVKRPKANRVAVFCGIGKPERFVASLEAAGVEVVDLCTAPDHTLPSHKALKTFAERAKGRGAELLVCTEKEGIKLTSPLSLPLPVEVVQGELEIVRGTTDWRALIERIKRL